MAQLVALFLVILFLTVAVAYRKFDDPNQEVEFEFYKRRYDICHLPVKPGHCRHRVKSWYFNPTTKKCERFIYTLCDGNANRFYTEEECFEFCNSFKYVFNLSYNDDSEKFPQLATPARISVPFSSR